MPNRKSKTSRKADEFVPVAFAGSMQDAADYCQLLEDHGIEAFADNGGGADGKIEDDDIYADATIPHGIPVFVNKSDVDEASEIISERDDVGAFGLDDKLDEDDDEDDFGMGPDMGDDDDLYGIGDDLGIL